MSTNGGSRSPSDEGSSTDDGVSTGAEAGTPVPNPTMQIRLQRESPPTSSAAATEMTAGSTAPSAYGPPTPAGPSRNPSPRPWIQQQQQHPAAHHHPLPDPLSPAQKHGRNPMGRHLAAPPVAVGHGPTTPAGGGCGSYGDQQHGQGGCRRGDNLAGVGTQYGEHKGLKRKGPDALEDELELLQRAAGVAADSRTGVAKRARSDVPVKNIALSIRSSEQEEPKVEDEDGEEEEEGGKTPRNGGHSDTEES